MYITIGSRWSIIAAQLPGRTDNDIKNYWNTRLKKKLLGKHRREQQAGKQFVTKKGCESLYPPPPQTVAAPPLLVKDQLHDSNSVDDVLLMPQLEAKFCYDDQNFESFQYFSDFSCPESHEQVGINFPGFDDILMYSVPPQLDGVQSFSPVDMVNGSTVSSVSQDNSSWGDISSLVYQL
ncbi:hypothetical protein CDL12_20051 [Handroanthus impetiginosus]|uniref:Uncharacterized protein n=1 Tax=Handroanthus impetiginosus TaxID=429701 RepID=A0A2G9GQ00_9LAMI|nr:hypothetical protein CDL12_20051 [Handroanthus impetiginosus]